MIPRRKISFQPIFTAVILVLVTVQLGYGQITVKYHFDCDSLLEEKKDQNIHKPEKTMKFMAATDLIYPSNWKNQDTINLFTFTKDNLRDKMPIITMEPPNDKNNNTGEISFSSLIYFEHGEYGENPDSNYYTDFTIQENELILKEKYWWSKGKGKKYKFKFLCEGYNCCKLIRTNPTKRTIYPKPIKTKDKKKLHRISNY